MVIREDDSLGLFVGETEKGKIRRKDMSPMGHKVRTMPISPRESLAELNALLLDEPICFGLLPYRYLRGLQHARKSE